MRDLQQELGRVTGNEETVSLGVEVEKQVTVFGFPAQMTSAVLTEFRSYGDVVKYQLGPGNWLHLKYQTKLQAQKALSMNGQRLNHDGQYDTIMLGVVKCSERLDGSEGTVERSDREARAPTRLRHRHRPRTSREHDMQPVDIMAPPAKRTNICTKIIEIIFNI